ncbi:MAG: DEAD/DEAH box helicase family protein [Alphaproteobacteria bacterium GM202ARS2]|nr:DEAD/DEAH box helicase family protein [Alphaproteobacteria bacterium GM202ARS2]
MPHGAKSTIENTRRSSNIKGINDLRRQVDTWRGDDLYAGVSKTTRTLLRHWFCSDHTIERPDGTGYPFHYYFCQREAIETLIYLIEVCGVNNLYNLIEHQHQSQAVWSEPSPGKPLIFNDKEGARPALLDDNTPQSIEALGIDPDNDKWGRYAFKMATGSGKTKCMSMALVWSYFHALFEPDSPMTKHFLAVAPSLTVYERLRQDFYPEDGRDIFQTDPLIPREWKHHWHLSVCLQDSALSYSVTDDTGMLYLTNIHRLLPSRKSDDTREGIDVLGKAPPSSTRKAMRDSFHESLFSLKRLMVLNDEAHHVWDPDSAWNQALRTIHDTIYDRQERQPRSGIIAQLDFSATPKDNKGNLFRHIICDSPLSEAVDAGIVKTPIIGESKELKHDNHDDAAIRYHHHLTLGYQRWLKSKKEWEKCGVIPLMFVMCENTDAANQITNVLNADKNFADLNGKVINLHTRLKGRIKKVGTGENQRLEFIEKESGISDEDLRQLRQLSRDLDSPQSPYRCIVSVLMLREGWDVRNVTVIVPLRPYTAESRILPEQTLGRGLRRILPHQDVEETVVVIDHPRFVEIYDETMVQEGLPFTVQSLNKVRPTTITIYVDEKNKDTQALNITIPRTKGAYQENKKPRSLTKQDVDQACKQSGFAPLKLGKKRSDVVNYQGYHYLTRELVEEMKLHMPLLNQGITGAISFYKRELRLACGHLPDFAWIAPHIKYFVTHHLFGKPIAETNAQLSVRLGDDDVRESILRVFVPLVNERYYRPNPPTFNTSNALKSYRPYQASYSEKRPAIPGKKTLFNLVPCDSSLEQRFAQFIDGASDVVAFAKNAGPQALHVNYFNRLRRPCIYIPDFIVRLDDSRCVLVELKGQEDRDVGLKVDAAESWCKIISKATKTPWQFLYVPEHVLQAAKTARLAMLMSTCDTYKKELLEETKNKNATQRLPFDAPLDNQRGETFYNKKRMAALSPRGTKAALDAYDLYDYLNNKEDTDSYAPAFQPLLLPLDHVADKIIIASIRRHLPDHPQEVRMFYDQSLYHAKDKKEEGFIKKIRMGLFYGNFHSALGILSTCIDYALNRETEREGVLMALQHSLKPVLTNKRTLWCLQSVNHFRNHYVAHYSGKAKPTEEQVKWMLRLWVETLGILETLLGDLTREINKAQQYR